ncbi:MAG TPA: hypothetical protein VMM35_06995 [Longimicrobiales bacterium]|nr:hypothetical protein [Longimicrobiales bacterium]
MSAKRPRGETPGETPEETVGETVELGEMLEPLRSYHQPGETPREEMWHAIVTRLRSEAAASGTSVVPEAPVGEPEAPKAPAGEAGVHSIARARPRLARAPARLARPVPWLGWAAAASVALLVGIAVGRSTAPGAPGAPDTPLAAVPAAASDAGASAPTAVTAGLDLAVRGHLGRTESLLAAVRSDGRQGRLDPGAAAWARGLLTQTRLLLDARTGGDPALRALLQDLELVLAEIVVVSQAGSLDGARAQTELDLVLQALELGSLLPRLQAACPRGCTTPSV